MSQAELERLLSYLKALANETRLKILGLLTDHERSVGELAELLRLKEPTISHHLALMSEAGFVTMRADGNTHLYRLNSAMLQQLSKDLFSPDKISAFVRPEADAAERKVLATFIQGERITQLPLQLRKRLVIIKWIADKFEYGVRYPEKELNTIIKRHHEDAATLRREMIEFRFMHRERGIYWRIPEEDRKQLLTEFEDTGFRDALK
jgi:hypothetical protein